MYMTKCIFMKILKSDDYLSSRLSQFTESASTAANLPRHHGSVAVKDDFIKVDRDKACFAVDYGVLTVSNLPPRNYYLA